MQTGLRRLKAMLPFGAAACLCLNAACKKDSDASSSSSGGSSSGNPITAPVDYVGAVGQAQKSAQKSLGSLGLDQAIKAFSAEEGRYPETLDELVSKGTISSIPKPPAGMKYDYNPKTGAVKVVPE